MKDKKQPQHPAAGLAIALGRTAQETVELFADAFAASIPAPQGYRSEPPVSLKENPCSEIDADFTITELDLAFRRSHRRTAPGPEGVTFQALRNLPFSHGKVLLESINPIWRAANIPAAWLTSGVVPNRKTRKTC